MDRKIHLIENIEKLAFMLQQSANKQDWTTLTDLDKKIVACVEELKRTYPHEDFSSLMHQLRCRYQHVYQHCEDQSQKINDKMTRHLSQREALTAYAIFSPDETE